MKREQFLLIKLAEECAEVAQRALKQIQFGANQIQKAGEVAGGSGPLDKEAGLTNLQRLQAELIDMTIIVNLLIDAKQLGRPSMDEYEEAKAKKIGKLNKYLTFSRQLGELDGDWVI